jgi:hypothetical protein
MPVAISVLGRVARWTWRASVLSRGWKRRWAWARRVQAGRYREANVVLGEALKLVRLLKTRALSGSVFHSLFFIRGLRLSSSLLPRPLVCAPLKQARKWDLTLNGVVIPFMNKNHGYLSLFPEELENNHLVGTIFGTGHKGVKHQNTACALYVELLG